MGNSSKDLPRNSLLPLQLLSKSMLVRHLLDQMSTASASHLNQVQTNQGTREATPSLHQVVLRDVTKTQTTQDERLNPATSPATLLTSSTCSKQPPLASSTSPPLPPGPLSPSFAPSPSSASSPAFLGSSSTPPSTWCLPPPSWASPCQPSWQDMSSTLW